ncbi:hypothetical protein KIN20_035326 [Parelaphostrongylus tenuis]|uniref:Uncharacterized protein n=1 Tax=Parelaphostrongylus tenuis TaxID=148309 RepID=A0AAD5RBN5_PARTN|nr:hypothetical protein KIN20_035326 [Parelaphostrongylus tenuis]
MGISQEYFHEKLRVYDALKEKYPILLRRKQAPFQQGSAKPPTTKRSKEKFDELEGIKIDWRQRLSSPHNLSGTNRADSVELAASRKDVKP